jgi:hypothetical protein
MPAELLPLIFRNIGEGIVRIEEIHLGPIGTPDCPHPTELPRYTATTTASTALTPYFLKTRLGMLSARLRARGSTVDERGTDIATTDPARSEASRLSRCVVRRPLQCRRRISWYPVEFVGPTTVDAARMSRLRSQGATGRASRQTSQLHRGFFDAIADQGNGQGTRCGDQSMPTGICAT